jgi:hypothetical protein
MKIQPIIVEEAARWSTVWRALKRECRIKKELVKGNFLPRSVCTRKPRELRAAEGVSKHCSRAHVAHL